MEIKKLSEIAVSVPGSTSLLREYDLDFCCGGSDTLSNAAAEKGLNLAEIETRLTGASKTVKQKTQKNIGLMQLILKLSIIS